MKKYYLYFNLLILILFSILLFESCSQNNFNKSIQIVSNSEAKTTLIDNNTVKEINSDSSQKLPNDIYMLGTFTTFGNYFQILWKTGKFDDMLKITSSQSIKKFGKEKILEFYKNMYFGYFIKLKSTNNNADNKMTTLNYETKIYATGDMVRINVIVENDTAKIILKDLKSIK